MPQESRDGIGKQSLTALLNKKMSREREPRQFFCMQWNEHQPHLIRVFDQLLENESLIDVTLVCDDKQSIKAHKLVLAASSGYFKLLFMNTPSKHPVVVLPDVEYVHLKALIEFIYKGQINVLEDDVEPLLKLAETLQVKGFTDTDVNKPKPKVMEMSTDTKDKPPKTVVPSAKLRATIAASFRNLKQAAVTKSCNPIPVAKPITTAAVGRVLRSRSAGNTPPQPPVEDDRESTGKKRSNSRTKRTRSESEGEIEWDGEDGRKENGDEARDDSDNESYVSMIEPKVEIFEDDSGEIWSGEGNENEESEPADSRNATYVRSISELLTVSVDGSTGAATSSVDHSPEDDRTVSLRQLVSMHRSLNSPTTPNSVSPGGTVKKGHPRILNVDEEQELVDYVIKLAEDGAPATRKQVLDYGNLLLRREDRVPTGSVHCNPEKGLSNDWWKEFKRRHCELPFASPSGNLPTLLRFAAITADSENVDHDHEGLS